MEKINESHLNKIEAKCPCKHDETEIFIQNLKKKGLKFNNKL